MNDAPFQITAATLAAIIAHAREAAPVECCGILIGRDGSIDDAARAKNLAGSPNRFLLDPKDHIEVRRTARGRGLDVIGFYHSHPHSPAWPSPTDIAEAAYPDAVQLIVSLEGTAVVARLFRLERGSAEELPLLVTA
jgi:proteasome lid subunit RPN8/RPN11